MIVEANQEAIFLFDNSIRYNQNLARFVSAKSLRLASTTNQTDRAIVFLPEKHRGGLRRQAHAASRKDRSMSLPSSVSTSPQESKLNTDIWRDIPGYPGYKASINGQIKSFKIYPEGKLLSPFFNNSGFSGGRLEVNIRRNKKPLKRSVAYLILLAFVGDRPPDHHVCHNDGDPHNNRLDNLRYDTPRENSTDRWKHNTMMDGEKHHKAMFTNEQVKSIRIEADRTGQSISSIAKQCNVSPQIMGLILRGKTYKNAGGPLRKTQRDVHRLTPLEVITIIKLYQQKKTSTYIANTLGRNIVTVARTIRAWEDYEGPVTDRLKDPA